MSCDYRGPTVGDSVAGFPGARPFLQSFHFQPKWHSFLSARHWMSHISSSEPREVRIETVPTATSGLLWPQSATERVVEPGQRGTQTASKPVFPFITQRVESLGMDPPQHQPVSTRALCLSYVGTNVHQEC